MVHNVTVFTRISDFLIISEPTETVGLILYMHCRPLALFWVVGVKGMIRKITDRFL